MKEFIESFCIVIASHISKQHRIQYLAECIESLTQQSIHVSIYLSISFETEEIKKCFYETIKKNTFFDEINICIREHKTSQMQHIYLLYMHVLKQHEWIMFCDDDDSYEPTRVQHFANYIYTNTHNPAIQDKKIAGCYESTFGKDHREQRHEYWCYCVNKEVIGRFYNSLQDYPDIIENKCCDVVFGEYLRRLSGDYIFIRIPEKLYNYRIHNNNDSITGFIQGNQHKYTKLICPPSLEDPTFADYIVDWNCFLSENIGDYLHDVFLRTIIGCDYDYILRSEFKADYELLKYVDQKYVDDIKNNHEYWLFICNHLYDIKFT